MHYMLTSRILFINRMERIDRIAECEIHEIEKIVGEDLIEKINEKLKG